MSLQSSLIDNLIKKGYLFNQPHIENALRRVPINLFIPKNVRKVDFEKPIPFINDRTISAPNVIVSLLSLLKIGAGHKVLIFGSKSGYIGSLISEIVETQPVYILEKDKQAAQLTKENVENAGYTGRVTVVNKDPLEGLSEEGPWDKILVTGAIPKLPEQVLEQLNDKGTLVAPIGSPEHQQLFEIYKDGDNIVPLSHGDFIFGPLHSDILQKNIILTEILDRKEVKKTIKEEQNLSQKCPLGGSCRNPIFKLCAAFWFKYSNSPNR